MRRKTRVRKSWFCHIALLTRALEITWLSSKIMLLFPFFPAFNHPTPVPQYIKAPDKSRYAGRQAAENEWRVQKATVRIFTRLKSHYGWCLPSASTRVRHERKDEVDGNKRIKELVKILSKERSFKLEVGVAALEVPPGLSHAYMEGLTLGCSTYQYQHFSTSGLKNDPNKISALNSVVILQNL